MHRHRPKWRPLAREAGRLKTGSVSSSTTTVIDQKSTPSINVAWHDNPQCLAAPHDVGPIRTSRYPFVTRPEPLTS